MNPRIRPDYAPTALPITVVLSRPDARGALWQLWNLNAAGYAMVSLERPNDGAEYPQAEVATAAEWFSARIARFDRDGYSPLPACTDCRRPIAAGVLRCSDCQEGYDAIEAEEVYGLVPVVATDDLVSSADFDEFEDVEDPDQAAHDAIAQEDAPVTDAEVTGWIALDREAEEAAADAAYDAQVNR